MSTDFAIIGTLRFSEPRELAAFLTERPTLDDFAQNELEWVALRPVPRKKEVSIEGHVEKSIYWSDVAPVLATILDVASRHGARGELKEVDVSGAGRRFEITPNKVMWRELTEAEAFAAWASAPFAPIRKRIDEALRAAAKRAGAVEIPREQVVSPRDLGDARRVLEHASLAMVGDTDGVTAARMLLDKDPSDDAVDRVLDAIERKWKRGGPSMMRGEDEALLRSVLVHHAHARIVPRATERLRALEASERATSRDAKRVMEGLAYLLERRR